MILTDGNMETLVNCVHSLRLNGLHAELVEVDSAAAPSGQQQVGGGEPLWGYSCTLPKVQTATAAGSSCLGACLLLLGCKGHGWLV